MRYLLAIAFATLFAHAAMAGSAESENAVTNILFDANMENVSYSFRANGFVDILFGQAVPEAQYVKIVETIRNHPDVPGVLAGRGTGNFCKVP